MAEFEKPGSFFLGKILGPKSLTNAPLLFEAKNLTTHAVCVGMTGSGKTGLGIALLEEAALGQIPAIIIDPKGDLGNLLLTFPELSPAEFKPWAEENQTPESLAKTWKEGLEAWHEGPERIKKFRDAVDLTIYTPASDAGTPLSILSSFEAPRGLDKDATRDKILSTTQGLLGLIGIHTDPLKSKEFTLLSLLIQNAWENGENLDLATLVGQIQNPPFAKVGALDIDTFYSPKERKNLSISLNNLLASPGFQAWMEGDHLSIDNLLYGKKGKPKLSIISIAHLSESERMFFVTLLLNEIIAWMRSQPGTSNLRAILYMDEIFGYFPPSAMPPSKLPMLTLLKQARAYGVGIVLCTQNPVDLDYKGLSNCGTWFIGKLQTARDKMRVIEGMKMASSSQTTKGLDKMLDETGKRTFILRSVHEKEPILFQTRWTLSYLYGPLTLKQIATLSDHKEKKPPKPAPSEVKPLSVVQYFAHPQGTTKPVTYTPKLIGLGKVHFVDAKNRIDEWQDLAVVFPVTENVEWERGENIPGLAKLLQRKPVEGSSFEKVPSRLAVEKNYAEWSKKFEEWIYQNQSYTIFVSSAPKMVSQQGESENDFRNRVALEMGNGKAHQKYAAKRERLLEKIASAKAKIEEKETNATLQKTETAISAGATLLGTLFGKRLGKGTITETGRTLRKASKIGKSASDIELARKKLMSLQQELDELDKRMQSEPSNLEIQKLKVSPRKSDISCDEMALLWVYS